MFSVFTRHDADNHKPHTQNTDQPVTETCFLRLPSLMQIGETHASTADGDEAAAAGRDVLHNDRPKYGSPTLHPCRP